MLPALYPHVALHLSDRLPALADKGSTGVGVGVRVPVRRAKAGPVLDPRTRTYKQLLTGLCALAGRANTLLTERWHALQHVILDPRRIGAIADAFVLTSMERGRW